MAMAKAEADTGENGIYGPLLIVAAENMAQLYYWPKWRMA